MSVLVDSEIRRCIEQYKSIVIDPFDEKALGTNSYDVHLAKTLKCYEPNTLVHGRVTDHHEVVLDCRKPNKTFDIEIPEEGFILEPGTLYLASTIEYTESLEHLPLLNGKSSVGRLGLSIHVTAGTGDVGFRGHWTMELFVIHPLRVYPGMAIGQLLWLTVNEAPDVPYNTKKSAKYNNRDPLPQASRLYQEHTRAESEE